MNGSALYDPTIDVRDPAWLRSALLYWDKIYTIVPRAIETPYKTDDTAICAKEGNFSRFTATITPRSSSVLWSGP